jgi:ABC-type glutathione transport system ATPase component
MKDINTKSIRFEKLHLHNYGIFYGSHDFVFERQQTIIVGDPGSGKTTIVNALANLGPARGVKPNFEANPQEMSVKVSTSGNPKLVEKYISLIFLGTDAAVHLAKNQETILSEFPDAPHKNTVKDEMGVIFRALLKEKPHKIKAHQDLEPHIMAMGETVCLGYAFEFTVRKVLNLDIPAVFDSPCELLDPQGRNGFYSFLKQQPFQQIMVCSASELDKNEGHYKLHRAGDL